MSIPNRLSMQDAMGYRSTGNGDLWCHTGAGSLSELCPIWFFSPSSLTSVSYEGLGFITLHDHQLRLPHMNMENRISQPALSPRTPPQSPQEILYFSRCRICQHSLSPHSRPLGFLPKHARRSSPTGSLQGVGMRTSHSGFCVRSLSRCSCCSSA